MIFMAVFSLTVMVPRWPRRSPRRMASFVCRSDIRRRPYSRSPLVAGRLSYSVTGHWLAWFCYVLLTMRSCSLIDLIGILSQWRPDSWFFEFISQRWLVLSGVTLQYCKTVRIWFHGQHTERVKPHAQVGWPKTPAQLEGPSSWNQVLSQWKHQALWRALCALLWDSMYIGKNQPKVDMNGK